MAPRITDVLQQVDKPWIAELYTGVISPIDIMDTIGRIDKIRIDAAALRKNAQDGAAVRDLSCLARQLFTHAEYIMSTLHEQEKKEYQALRGIKAGEIDTYFYARDRYEHIKQVKSAFALYHKKITSIDSNFEVMHAGPTFHLGGAEFLELRQVVIISKSTRDQIGTDTVECIRAHATGIRLKIDEGYRLQSSSREIIDIARDEAWKIADEDKYNLHENFTAIAARIEMDCMKLDTYSGIVGELLESERKRGKLGARGGRRRIITELTLLHDGIEDLVSRANDARADFLHSRRNLDARSGWQP